MAHLHRTDRRKNEEGGVITNVPTVPSLSLFLDELSSLTGLAGPLSGGERLNDLDLDSIQLVEALSLFLHWGVVVDLDEVTACDSLSDTYEMMINRLVAQADS